MLKLHELSNTVCCISWLMLKLHEPRPLVKVNQERICIENFNISVAENLVDWLIFQLQLKISAVTIKKFKCVSRSPGWCWNYTSLAIVYVSFPGWCWNCTGRLSEELATEVQAGRLATEVYRQVKLHELSNSVCVNSWLMLKLHGQTVWGTSHRSVQTGTGWTWPARKEPWDRSCL